MKYCHKCQNWKQSDEFNKNSLKPDGLQSQCRECQKISNRAYINSEKGIKTRIARAEVYKENGKRQQIQYRYNHSQKNREAQRRYTQTENGKANLKKNRYKAMAQFPEKEKARKAVWRAVVKGTLPRIYTRCCSICGEQAHEYHHHNGYSKDHWLDVIPMCRIHHRMVD